jgi:hypothetical protein
VITVEGDALLAPDEAEALAQFEQEGSQLMNDGLLQVALVPL